MARCRIVLFLLVLVCNAAHAQDNRYMIFFGDKNGSSFSVSNPNAFLSERAVARRNRQHIPITDQDFPVASSYIEGVRAVGCQVLYASRWVNAILVQCDAGLLPTVEALSYVIATELVAPGQKPKIGGRQIVNARTGAGGEANAVQNKMLGIDAMHAAGYRGAGVQIAVLDAGFMGVDVASSFSALFSDNRVPLTYDFVYNQTDVYQHDNHGTEVLSTMGAYADNEYMGSAPNATYQLYVTEYSPTEYRIEEYNWIFAAERADSAGVDIICSSLGYNTFDLPSMDYTQADMDGKTAVVTKGAQWAADRGILVVVSAGNEGANGWKIVTAPADGADVIAVGSVGAARIRANSSSVGPAADGRMKPDVAAMGAAAVIVKPNGATATNSGTSFAAPQVAGLLAGVWQRYPEKSAKEIAEVLKSSASQASSPDNLLGYGIPNFTAIVNKFESEDQSDLFVVYPNPTGGTFYIKPKDPTATAAAVIEIVSVQGQVLATQAVAFDWLHRAYEVDGSSLASGLYFVRVRTGDGVFRCTIVKGKL